jgi:phage tail sheath protein FI
MGDPVFGVVFRKMDEEQRPVVAADLSTIGIIGPAPLAAADIFPLNDPVKLNSDDVEMLGYLGEGGYIADAIRAINDQLGELQYAARIVVVRTAEGTHVDPTIKAQQTISNVVGNSLTRTGIHAFLKAGNKLGVIPRIIIAPGYTGQMANGINVITRTGAGSGYLPGKSYPLVFSGGGATAVQATGHAIGNADGTLGLGVLDTPGAWYTSNPTIAAAPPDIRATASFTATVEGGIVTALEVLDGGAGYHPGDIYDLIFSGGTPDTPATGEATGQIDGTLGNPVILTTGAGYDAPPAVAGEAPPAGTTATYTATIAAGANPICASLTGVLNQLVGHAIVESSGISEQNDIDWRETFQSQRLIPVSGTVRVMDPVTSNIIFRPLAPRVAGILVRRDHEKGAPFHSAANQPIQGIIGPGRDMSFSIVDDANEGQALLKANIGIVATGEIGVESAIASGGFVFVGTDNAGEDELWRFYNVTRGRDFIHLSLLRALRFFLGRYNISAHTVQAILNTMSGFLRDLQADGNILGYRMNFRQAGNSAEEIRLGHLTVGFKAEEPPVLRKIVTESYRYRPAIDDMVANLEAQLNLAA